MVRLPSWHRCWPAALLLAWPVLHAQPQGGPRPDPLDPAASVPAATHRSAFEGYRRHADARPLPWKDANDQVTRIGGWRAYAREAAAPVTAAASSAAAPASAPAPAPTGASGRPHHHGGPR